MLELLAAGAALLVALKNLNKKGVSGIGYAAAHKPWWYGIKGIQFIYHGEWADPELYYRGKLYNETEAWEYCYGSYEIDIDDGVFSGTFEEWMAQNAYRVKEDLRYSITPKEFTESDMWRR